MFEENIFNNFFTSSYKNRRISKLYKLSDITNIFSFLKRTVKKNIVKQLKVDLGHCLHGYGQMFSSIGRKSVANLDSILVSTNV